MSARASPAPAVEWKRYGLQGRTIHAAHAFVDGRQLCSMAHGTWLAPNAARVDYGPHPVPLHSSGVPFGRVCARCLKLARGAA